MDVDYFEEKLGHLLAAKVAESRLSLSGAAAKLSALNPLDILSRGYSVAFDGEGRIVKSVRTLQIGDALTVRLADGRVTTTVTEIETKKTRKR